jgi:menaquinone-dependent protoporphyrinogen IX oxidase
MTSLSSSTDTYLTSTSTLNSQALTTTAIVVNGARVRRHNFRQNINRFYSSEKSSIKKGPAVLPNSKAAKKRQRNQKTVEKKTKGLKKSYDKRSKKRKRMTKNGNSQWRSFNRVVVDM